MVIIVQAIANAAALAMEVAATIIVSAGAAFAFVRLVLWTFGPRQQRMPRRKIWRDFGMALLLALEFMLAADIVRTAIAPTWQQIGQLAAIAAIRTFLNYFLVADIERTTSWTGQPEQAHPEPASQ